MEPESIKVVLYVMKAVRVIMRPMKRLAGAYRVLRNPHAAPKDHADEILDEAFKRLGYVEAQDPLWIKATAKVTALITPEHMRKPHVQSWIARNKDDLKLLASSAKLPSDADLYLRLRDAYMDASGENERYADSAIHTVFAYLRYSLQMEVKDRGLAAQLDLALEAIELGHQELSNPSLMPPHTRRSATAAPPSPRLDVAEVRWLFGDASRFLLNWPQETNGRWIERPELDTLRQSATEESNRPTILLGPPGSGKSAILARLGTELQNGSSVALLAIKADQLPRRCQTQADIDSHVGCSVVDAIRQIAKNGRVTVLIDQLDALAELMDQHSGRLGALLQLAGSICAISNVSVLMSCREFEFQSDLRLSSLEAEQVRIETPPWEAVEPLLQASGVAVEQLTDEQREVLRTPQHLAVFISYFAKQSTLPTFSTYQALLDQVTRDLATRHGERTVLAAERIATTMAEVEELWVARVRFEAEHGDEVARLLAAGVLVTSDDDSQVSFRHQTMFDFLRARAFLRGTTELADYILRVKQESLFVRPVLWSALTYLRSADRGVYRREFAKLWTATDLRLHLRVLLASHLAQLPDPDVVEAAWLLPTLSDSALRPRVVNAMAGSPGWFELMKPRLGAYMVASTDQAREAAFLLGRALSFARPDVLELLRENWLGEDERCADGMDVLGYLTTWDAKSGRLAAQFAAEAGRKGMDAFLTCELVSKVVKTSPESAAQVLFHYLEERSRNARSTELAMLIREHHWSRLNPSVSAAPEHFIQAGWQWLTGVLERLAAPTNEWRYAYRSCPDLDVVSVNEQPTLLSVFEEGMVAYAQRDPEGFLGFIAQARRSDIMLHHSLLGHGLRQIAASRPDAVVDYLLEDGRRLAVGDLSGEHRHTLALIASVFPSIDDDDCRRLESGVLASSRYRDLGETGKQRFDRRKWDRGHRLRLLRAFPEERLTAEARRLRAEEERALPSANAPDGMTIRGGVVGSPMSAEQMVKATDEAIIHLFEVVTDRTGWTHPARGDNFVGGSIQASRAFAEFAKAQPDRALDIIAHFQPAGQEGPAGEALAALGKSDVPPETLLPCIRDLDAKGFSSDDFRANVAQCLSRVAARDAGLDDDTCGLLESWITEPVDENDDGDIGDEDDTELADARSHSILWSMGMFAPLPHGNYPLLDALALGHLCREPMDADGFLDPMERHLGRKESDDVWVAMMRYLVHLNRADSARAAAFLVALLETRPDAWSTQLAVRFVVSALAWIPRTTLDRIFEHWTSGGWKLGAHAAGEVAALALCRNQDDRDTRDRVERYLDRNGQPSDLHQSLVAGIAHTLIEAARDTGARAFATPYLVRVIAMADEHIAPALHRLFWGDRVLCPDEHSRRILHACIENAHVLDVEHGSPLVSRLQSLLAAGWTPELVYKVAVAYLDARERAPGDALRYSYTDDQLVDVALTLHHIPQTRTDGLDLFERLMALSAYGVRKKLATLDRRAP